MKNEEIEIGRVFFECDCYMEGITLSMHRWNDEEDMLYLSFWIDEWYQDKIWKQILNRVKLAWKVLVGGDYFLKEIILKRKNVERLKNELSKF